MKTSDELFRLIKSLSKSEKRYFKLFTSLQQGEKNYLRLFDAIDTQDEYDEPAIRAKFSREKFTRQLNVAKKYLHELILKSLRVYHTEYAANVQAKDLIKSAEILYEKGLDNQAARMLEKAIKLAGEHEAIAPLLEALTWKGRMQLFKFDAEAEIDEHYDRLSLEVEKLRTELELGRNLQKILLEIRTNPVRTDEARASLERFTQTPLLGMDAAVLTVRARSIECFTMTLYNSEIGDMQQALHFAQRQVDLIEANPICLSEYPEHYVAALGNLMLVQRVTLNMAGFWDSVRRLREAERTIFGGGRLRSPRMRYELFTSVNLNLLCLSLALGNFDEAKELVDIIGEGLESYTGYIDDYLRFTFNLHTALAYFGLGQFRRALDCINSVLAEPPGGRAKPAQDNARIINLILHFELGNIELLPYLVKSTYRHFRSQNLLHGFESAILEFFRKLPAVRTGTDLTAEFRALRDVLLVLQNDPNEQSPFSAFYYIEWLESKIEKRNFAEIVRVHASERFGTWENAA